MATDALRQATLTLSEESAIPVFERFDRSSAVSLDATRYISPVEDGQYASLTDISGDLAAARDLLATTGTVRRYAVGGTDDHGIVYTHHRSVAPIQALLDILYTTDIVLDWPVAHRRTDRGPESRFTIIGTTDGIRRAVAAVPDLIEVSVERVGRFESSAEPTSVLTDDQRALLGLALEEGYYEVPRETTQRALADELDLAPGTVADRLQRIERRVMTAYMTEFGR